jgi:hypothetical protein
VPLVPGEPAFVCGQRADGALLGLPLIWPPGLPRGAAARIDELIVIITAEQVVLRCLETTDRIASARAPGSKLQDLIAQLQDGVPRNLRSAHAMQDFMLRRIVFFLDPGRPAGADRAIGLAPPDCV